VPNALVLGLKTLCYSRGELQCRDHLIKRTASRGPKQAGEGMAATHRLWFVTFTGPGSCSMKQDIEIALYPTHLPIRSWTRSTSPGP
jgi:hypothetical protein